jgi:His-Xaa-Ser repeat protein HxsA
MKSITSFRFLPALVAGIVLSLPATGFARKKIEVRRDLDGDGHYNTKTYRVDNHRHSRHYGGSRYYGGHGYGYGRPYYYNDYYRPSYYYSRPYYYDYSPSIGVSYYSRPSYSYSRSYRSYTPSYSSYADDLAVDVQRALKRRGYYRGSIDGDIGPGSRSAIRAYQADRGLPVTGRIDSRLLRALGIG